MQFLTHIFESLKQTFFVPIHPAGLLFIVIFGIIGIILTLLWEFLFFPSLILTLWCVYFFRNPKRVTPLKEDIVVAPADGYIFSIDEELPPEELDLPQEKHIHISIAMNIFNVHVNRSPMGGTITDKFYFPGISFFSGLDKDSPENERLGLVMNTDSGIKIGFVQIAGLIARRILCETEEGDRLEIGQQYGIIRFGSRVDVWLPKPVKVMVLRGQRSIAGETILADYGKGAKAITEGMTR